MATSAIITQPVADLLDRIANREHLQHDEWARVIEEAETENLRRLADDLRREFHPDNAVTYVVDRNINYSNVCFSVCNFCAFYRKPGHPEGYVLGYDEIFEKVEEMIELGGSGVLMQGGLHPDLPMDWYTGLLSQLKRRYGIHLHCFSPTEIYGMSKTFGMSYEQVISGLRDAGLDSIPGGGGEILVDEIRRKRRTECNSQEWLDVMEAAHKLGIKTTATMMIGYGETISHRIQHLEKLRQSQRRALDSGKPGFVSFIPWTFQPDNTPLGKIIPDRMPAEEYLRWLALSRVYLNNIPNVQVSWLTVGLKDGRRGLHFGANDIGSTMIEENVISKAGANHKATEQMLVNVIVEEGFKPVKRKADYTRLS
ncbi:MAG TPA: cyclic dehypoxanthinyl futalosine synthase [Blastocatellia bacterium]|jgi:cyclic dehypoxanthinyl futalosine synthase|nr:cyclic dehypoxanthinyl futalosine synthase [Blastocatellia bacterium]